MKTSAPLPFTLCVYCGSRPGQDPAHMALAREVGHWLGEHGARLVYGGGHHGLMGAVADAALEAGAHVTGVIPQALVKMEAAHRGCSELHVVANMHERKRLMAERAVPGRRRSRSSRSAPGPRSRPAGCCRCRRWQCL